MITSLVASGFDPVTTAAVVGDHIQILAQVPDLNPQQPPGGEKFISLAGWIKWGVMLASVLALLFAAGKFGYEKYFAHGEVQSPKQVIGALIGGVIGSIATVLMNTVWG
ncbi:hypothetical protein [Corynebacterium bovis]|uniref:hypothetical protein n=1 Tax=Corynebacterium bovis TaxID=36808 RepID=UPI0021AB36FA|nr:hypothetical protein [Corynebacterium bovis]MDN8578301.1 hypothetical protein [Corynebacterium bovis]